MQALPEHRPDEYTSFWKSVKDNQRKKPIEKKKKQSSASTLVANPFYKEKKIPTASEGRAPTDTDTDLASEGRVPTDTDTNLASKGRAPTDTDTDLPNKSPQRNEDADILNRRESDDADNDNANVQSPMASTQIQQPRPQRTHTVPNYLQDYILANPLNR
jgi:hypothetical protein